MIKLNKDPDFAKKTDWHGVFFNTRKSIFILPTGNIWVVNTKEHNVTILSPIGKVIKVIGRKGQGPGDFYRPSNIIYMNLSVYISDAASRRKITKLDFKGNFKKVIRTQKRCYQITPLSNNRLAYLYFKTLKFQQKIDVIIKDLTTNKEISILTKTIPYKSVMYFDKGRYMIGLGNHIGEFFIRSSKNNSILIGYSGDNKIYEYNNEGVLVQTIVLNKKPIPVTGKYIKDFKTSCIEYYEKINLKYYLKEIKKTNFSRFVSENLPQYADISIDTEGNIILLDWNKNFHDNSKYLRIYSPKGKFISHCSIDEKNYETEFKHYCLTNKGIFCLVKNRGDEDAWPEIIRIK